VVIKFPVTAVTYTSGEVAGSGALGREPLCR
jgi:hypothetical protein